MLPARSRAVPGILAVALALAGCADFDNQAAAQGLTRNDLVAGLAAQLSGSASLTYAAAYQLSGGATATIAQAQNPSRTAYRYPGGAVLVTTADGPHRAVRAASRHPDLVEAVVCVGGPPISRSTFPDAEAMASSETVVDALLEMATTDYRAALRSLTTSANPQMTEQEIRERIDTQSEYATQEASLARLRAWTDADSTEHSRALGDRLWILHAPGLGGGWFPTGRELESIVTRTLPEAQLEEIDNGMLSRPDQTADVVRRITSRVRTARS